MAFRSFFLFLLVASSTYFKQCECYLVYELVFEDDGCRTPNRGVGNCIPLSSCTPMIELLTTIQRPISEPVLKKIQAYTCGLEGSSIKVCCPSGPIELGGPNKVLSSREPPDVSSHRNLGLLPRDCGFLNSNNRIVGGDNAFLNEFPWMALLQYSTSKGLDFKCGGSVISKKYILTAAHCVKGLSSTLSLHAVRVGEYDLSTTIDCEVTNKTRKCNPPVQDLRVEKVIVHPGFGDGNVGDDIALIRVSTINFDVANVLPICLPLGKERTKAFNGGFVTGWGITNSYIGSTANILQKVRLPLVDHTTCANAYRGQNTRGGQKISLTNKQICLGGLSDKDSCKGDSGGPMVVPTLNDDYVGIYVQQGIVSLGPARCANEQFPGLYTAVAYYMDWILDNIQP